MKNAELIVHTVIAATTAILFLSQIAILTIPVSAISGELQCRESGD